MASNSSTEKSSDWDDGWVNQNTQPYQQRADDPSNEPSQDSQNNQNWSDQPSESQGSYGTSQSERPVQSYSQNQRDEVYSQSFRYQQNQRNYSLFPRNPGQYGSENIPFQQNQRNENIISRGQGRNNGGRGFFQKINQQNENMLRGQGQNRGGRGFVQQNDQQNEGMFPRGQGQNRGGRGFVQQNNQQNANMFPRGQGQDSGGRGIVQQDQQDVGGMFSRGQGSSRGGRGFSRQNAAMFPRGRRPSRDGRGLRGFFQRNERQPSQEEIHQNEQGSQDRQRQGNDQSLAINLYHNPGQKPWTNNGSATVEDPLVVWIKGPSELERQQLLNNQKMAEDFGRQSGFPIVWIRTGLHNTTRGPYIRDDQRRFIRAVEPADWHITMYAGRRRDEPEVQGHIYVAIRPEGWRMSGEDRTRPPSEFSYSIFEYEADVFYFPPPERNDYYLPIGTGTQRINE